MTKIIMAAAQSQARAPYQRHYINIIMARDQANESACRGAHFEPRGASSWPTPLAVRCLASEWIICLPEQTTTMRAVDSSDSPSAGASHFRKGLLLDPPRKYRSEVKVPMPGQGHFYCSDF
ncbi:uncharacterized protein LOC116842440 [Odontomachus brunneus]|uniref:uncharacterized protein LOC116842440 n=1 Tax=Odontomachus brunneus TaxID=486640 RepID=UPI0013F28060|nr:uncharacterized protein LOC116842440 [Odontomachus brunneus]